MLMYFMVLPTEAHNKFAVNKQLALTRCLLSDEI